MNLRTQKTVLFALLVTLAFSGCRKKKEPTVTPQAQAPTVTAPQKPPATTQKEPAKPAPSESAPATTAPAPAASPSTATTKPKPKRTPKQPKQEPGAAASNGSGQKAGAEAPSTTASATTPAPGTAPAPPKVVVKEGGDDTPGQISAAGDNHEGSRQSIEQLLNSTDNNLKNITSRQLNDEERAMVEQIRNYMTQARVASTDGDLTRANNLALKAHLLSDELVKR